MCHYCTEFAAETRTTGASIVYTGKVFGKLMAWLVAINVLMELVIAAAAVAKVMRLCDLLAIPTKCTRTSC